MQELERSPVCDDTLLVVYLLINGDRLEDVLPEHVLLGDIVEVVVVDGGGGEGVVGVLLDIAVVDVLQDELAEFGDQDVDVLHDLVQIVEHHLLDNVLLGQ